MQELDATPAGEPGGPLDPTPEAGAPSAPSENAAPDPAAAAEATELYEAGRRAALAMFVDAHNTGYYINSYTTKLNPTMDTRAREAARGGPSSE